MWSFASKIKMVGFYAKVFYIFGHLSKIVLTKCTMHNINIKYSLNNTYTKSRDIAGDNRFL